MQRTLAINMLLALGMVGLTGLVAHANDASAELFQRLDADANGELAAEDLPSDQRRLFARLLRTSDLDDSGSLSAAEFALAVAPGRAKKPIEEKLPGQLPGADAVELMLLKMDANRDSSIERPEVPGELLPFFNQMVRRIDKNDDEVLDRRELSRGGPQLGRLATRAVEELDLDVAGELAKFRSAPGGSAARFDTMPDPAAILADPKQAQAMFRRLDADGDGNLTVSEVPDAIQSRIEQWMRLADRDGDDRLTQREFLAGAKIAARRMQMADATPAVSPRDQRARSQDVLEQMLRAMDRDENGQLSRHEAVGRLARDFGRVDRNGDGVLDAAELQRAAALVRTRMRGRGPAGGKANSPRPKRPADPRPKNPKP